MNDACAELMREEGIDAKICFVSDRYPLSHCDGNFEVAGKYYYFNLAVDLMKIQTGMKTRNFGISQNRIFQKLKNKSKNSEEDLTDHLAKMNKQNNVVKVNGSVINVIISKQEKAAFENLFLKEYLRALTRNK